MDKKYFIAISNMSSLLVHTLIFEVKLLNVMRLPSFPICFIIRLNAFKNCDWHVGFAMSREVKMSPCGLLKILIVYISKVLTKSSTKSLTCFSYILVLAFEAVNQIHKISSLAVVFSGYLYNFVWVCGFDNFALIYIRANLSIFVASFHSRYSPFWPCLWW